MERMRKRKRTFAVCAIRQRRGFRYLALVVLSVVGCATAPSRPNVTYSPNHNLLAVGYDADRLDAIWKAEGEAKRYCWNYQNHQIALMLNESTVYQGRFDEPVVEARASVPDRHTDVRVRLKQHPMFTSFDSTGARRRTDRTPGG